MPTADFRLQGIHQRRKKPLDLAGNHPVAEIPGRSHSPGGTFPVLNLRQWFRATLRGIGGKKHFIKDFQGMFRLLNLPIFIARTLPQIRQEIFDIVTGAIEQPLSGQKIDKRLRPFDIKNRSVRPHPVLLHAGLKSVPELLRLRELDLTFFVHKFNQIRIVNGFFPVPC
ncbi:MAG: hypothetical protein ACOY32_08585 [Thermodesulfobacteriota bacterium]